LSSLFLFFFRRPKEVSDLFWHKEIKEKLLDTFPRSLTKSEITEKWDLRDSLLDQQKATLVFILQGYTGIHLKNGVAIHWEGGKKLTKTTKTAASLSEGDLENPSFRVKYLHFVSRDEGFSLLSPTLSFFFR